MVFSPGRWFFRSCFTASSRRQQNLSKNAVFSDFRRHVRQFFGVVLELARRPSEAWCFPAGRWFFRSCFTAAAAGNRRVSDDTLGSFLAWFWNWLVLQRHGVSPPGSDFFEAVFYCQQPQATGLRCFVLFPFLAPFRLLWRKMGQDGPR